MCTSARARVSFLPRTKLHSPQQSTQKCAMISKINSRNTKYHQNSGTLWQKYLMHNLNSVIVQQSQHGRVGVRGVCGLYGFCWKLKFSLAPIQRFVAPASAFADIRRVRFYVFVRTFLHWWSAKRITACLHRRPTTTASSSRCIELHPIMGFILE